MIGSLYFVVKSSVITFLIVCLLQIQFHNKTLEDRLMKFVRKTLAPQVLGKESVNLNHRKYRLEPKEMAELKKRIFESDALKGVKKSAKAIFFKEMTDVMEKSKNTNEENEDEED